MKKRIAYDPSCSFESTARAHPCGYAFPAACDDIRLDHTVGLSEEFGGGVHTWTSDVLSNRGGAQPGGGPP
jgi:hypothetical protein